jgi:SAM-dependent methyltransferase
VALDVTPPPTLTTGFGGTYQEYAEIGSQHVVMLRTMLPENWSWGGKRVLDFGCGAGRTLQALTSHAGGAELWGCDIQEGSIAWAIEHLPPATRFLVNAAEPPLDVPDCSFNLIYGMSVFTHITDPWAAWVLEMRRLLAPGGLGVFTFLGEAMWTQVLGRPWEPERIGMICTSPGAPWAAGGPNVFHSEWWLREHWGRAFDILAVRPPRDQEAIRHGWLVVRRDERCCDIEELERVDGRDPREVASLQLSLEIASHEAAHLRREHARTADELRVVLNSRSWRFTAPLRRVRRAARGR